MPVRGVFCGRRLGALFVAFAAAVAVPGVAAAAERGVTVADPNDAPPVLSGQQDEDVRQVAVRYADAGSVAIDVAFFASLNGSRNTELSMSVELTSARSDGESCAGFAEAGHASVFLWFKGSASGALLSITGFDGSVRAPLTLNGDGTVASATISHPALANRNYRCAQVGDLYTHYYEFSFCTFSGCPRKAATVDEIGKAVWFNGYAPACDDGKDNEGDGKIDANDPDCASPAGTSEGKPPTPKPVVKPRSPLGFKYQLKLIRKHPEATPPGTTYYGATLRVEVYSPSLRKGERVPFKLCVLRRTDKECHAATLTPRRIGYWTWRVDPDEGRNRKLTFEVVVKNKVVATKSLRIYESS